jgi:hypothetical protein
MSDFKKTRVLRGKEPLKLIFDDVTNIGGIFCGGYVRYMISRKENPPAAQDIDIYSQSEEIYDKLVAYFKNLGLKINKESDYSTSFNIRYDDKGRISCPPSNIDEPVSKFLWNHKRSIIQLVKPVNKGKMVCKGNLEEILSNFDFTIVRCGLLSLAGALIDEDFHNHDKKNLLIFKNIHSPVSSIFRIVKYGQKGYRIKPSHLVKMFFDWDKRDPEWKNRVKDAVNRFEKYGVRKNLKRNTNARYIEEIEDIDSLTIDEMTELETLLFVGEEL